MQIESVKGNASVVAVFEIGNDPERGTGVEVQVPDAVNFFAHDGNNKNGLTWASLVSVQECITHYGASVAIVLMPLPTGIRINKKTRTFRESFDFELSEVVAARKLHLGVAYAMLGPCCFSHRLDPESLLRLRCGISI